MGAQIIEKHFTINKRDKVVDKVVSIDEKQMKKLNIELNNLSKILGSDYMGLRKSEKVAEQFKNVLVQKSLESSHKNSSRPYLSIWR